jgi:hypothetical protein
MVQGIDTFRAAFRGFEDCFVLIGGAACDEWFAGQAREFRATKDLDLVLIIEVLDARFVAAMRRFLGEGGYRIREKSTGRPELYRFAEPSVAGFPAQIELFSRSPEPLDFSPGEVVPVIVDPDHHSLSAILLQEDYYNLIRTHHDVRDGLHIANASALIPLKAYAWLDLSRRKSEGEKIDSKNISKHRSDVFRLAAMLPGEPGPELPVSVLKDLRRFLEAFPMESDQWPAIRQAVKETLGTDIRPSALVEAVKIHFRIA